MSCASHLTANSLFVKEGSALTVADYYYYATAGGAKIWVSSIRQNCPEWNLANPPQWKKYLTTLQITQFVIDLFIVYFASTCLFSHRLRHNAYPSLTSLLPPSSHLSPSAEKKLVTRTKRVYTLPAAMSFPAASVDLPPGRV